MPSKHPPFKLSREEETFLRHWMYEEAHQADGSGQAKRLQVEHQANPGDLNLLISAAFPDSAVRDVAALGPPPSTAPTWPWPDDALTIRVAEARAELVVQPRPQGTKKRKQSAKTGSNRASKKKSNSYPIKDTPLRFRLLRALEGHAEKPVIGVAWSPNGRLLATRKRGTVQVWNADSGERVHSITGIEGPSFGLAWSPDSLLLAVGSTDRRKKENGKISILNTRSGDIYSKGWEGIG
jgi:WD40 repeat protein